MSQLLGTSTLVGDAGAVGLMGAPSASAVTAPVFTPASSPNLAGWYAADNGPQTDGAAQFTTANGTYLTNASLKPSGSFACGGWFFFDALQANSLVCQFTSLGSSKGNMQLQADGNGAVHFRVFNQGVTSAEAVSTLLSTGQWYFVVGWYSAVSNSVSVKVSSLAAVSASVGFTPTFSDVATLAIGARAGNNAIEILGGRADSCFFYGGEFTAQMFADLYNGGAGCTYATCPASVQPGLVSWWDLDEPTATSSRFDSKGSFHLTPAATSGGGPTAAVGITQGAASDGDPVRQWNDLSGLSRHATQTTLAAKPIFKAAQVNGKPAIQCDGVDDALVATIPATTGTARPFSVVVTIKSTLLDGVGSGRSYAGLASSTTPAAVYMGTLNANLMAWRRNDGNAIVFSASGNNAAQLNVWMVLSITYDGGTIRVYKNGSLVVSVASTGVATIDRFSLGACSNGASNLSVFQGLIAEATLSEGALADADRQALERYMGGKYGITVA